MRRARALTAALLLAIATIGGSAPAAAFVPNVGLFEPLGGGTPKCVGFTGGWSSLTSACSSPGWANRANSWSASLLAGQCARVYSGTGYSGSFTTLYGPRSINTEVSLPNSLRENVESLRANGTGEPGEGCTF